MYIFPPLHFPFAVELWREWSRTVTDPREEWKEKRKRKRGMRNKKEKKEK
jgi:hypothetical protein